MVMSKDSLLCIESANHQNLVSQKKSYCDTTLGHPDSDEFLESLSVHIAFRAICWVQLPPRNHEELGVSSRLTPESRNMATDKLEALLTFMLKRSQHFSQGLLDETRQNCRALQCLVAMTGHVFHPMLDKQLQKIVLCKNTSHIWCAWIPHG